MLVYSQARVVTSVEEAVEGALQVVTGAEVLSIPLRYQSLAGTLQISPSVVRLDAAFPGKMVRKPLWAWSTYQVLLYQHKDGV